ncbi:hypothetical protein BJ741DRAFT_661998 [Chytriomyces cf. hyalinus JEL632]|nr:hypothetical protein BJ741DRAFT_661998 [Chytriomyces cf. hyalinus JEL632]
MPHKRRISDHDSSQSFHLMQLLFVGLAQTPFLETLAEFESRTAYGCVQYDMSVGFETSLIRVDNPYLERFSTQRITQPFQALMNWIPVDCSFNFTSVSSSQLRLKDVSTPAGDMSSLLDSNSEFHVQQMLQSLNS